MKLHEQIAKVREVIQERGLERGHLQNDATGTVCIRGAEGIVLAGDAYYWNQGELDQFLLGFAAKRAGLEKTAIIYINADGETTDDPDDAFDAVDPLIALNDQSTSDQEVIDFLHDAEIAAKELENA